MDIPALPLAQLGLESPTMRGWDDVAAPAGEASADPAAWFRGTADAMPLRLSAPDAGARDIASLAQQVLSHLLA